MTETSIAAISSPSVLARRVAITLLLLAASRIPDAILIPGIDPAQLPQEIPASALVRFSLGALGLTPYVTAWVIVHLLHAFMPFGHGTDRRDAARAERPERAIRCLTLVLALLQGIVLGGVIDKLGGTGHPIVAEGAMAFPLIAGLSCAANVFFLIWLGDKISRHGIGFGLPLLIAAPILTALPQYVGWLTEMLRAGATNDNQMLALMTALIATVFATTLVAGARYLLPVRHSGNGSIHEAGLSLIPGGILAPLCTVMVMRFLTQEAEMVARAFDPSFAGFPVNMGLVALLLCPVAFAVSAIAFGPVMHDPADLAEAVQRDDGTLPDIPIGAWIATSVQRKAIIASAIGGSILALFVELPELVAMALGVRTPITGSQLMLVALVALACQGRGKPSQR